MSPVVVLLLQLLTFHVTNSQRPTWSQCETSLPTTLSTFVAGFYENSIYLIGGTINRFGTLPNRNISILNLTDGLSSEITDIDSTLEWQMLDEFPPNSMCCFDTQYRRALTVHSHGSSYTDKMLFIVPSVSDNSLKPTVLLIFDMSRKSYRSPQDYNYELMERLSDPCIVSTATAVYLMGGVHWTPPANIEWKDTFQIYNIANDTWSLGPSLVIARRAAACNIVGNNLYVFGGELGPSDLDSIERYNLVNGNEWQVLPGTVLLKPDDELRTIVDKENDLIYLFGGAKNTSTIQIFDKNAMIVTRLYAVNETGDELPQRMNVVPLLFDSKGDDDTRTVFLMGGSDEKAVPYKTIYSASLDGLSRYHLEELKRIEPLQTQGDFTTVGAISHTIHMGVQVNLLTNKVYITLDGPATRWFAIGFDASSMSDQPYTIFVYGNQMDVTVEERKLGVRGVGDALESMLTVVSVTDYDTVIDGTPTTYREVQLSRDRSGISNDHYSFPNTEGEMLNMIFAHGISENT
eukprot:405073_1